MNSPERIAEAKQTPVVYLLLRCSIALLFPLILILVAVFSVVIFALFLSNFSISYPISVPCQCRIVSSTCLSNVDLRSTKVCELGLLNYKAKHVFYPSEKKKFRCRHDYYWASVFEVEYTDHSGHLHTAFAEAPNEALPLDCRPTFNAAWMAKDRFKVNETYDCWYTLGISKLNLYYDEFFNCQADHPSTTEMLKRYLILSMEMFTSWFSQKGRSNIVSWGAIAGAVTGFVTSLITVALGRMLYLLKSRIVSTSMIRDAYLIRLKRACFLVAYFSFVSWLAVQYWGKLGLLDIFGAHT
ncbi:hypothetical protein Hdeb2414_s0001g00012371 [Helianthus debilis subsp. tardiflorus]